MKFINTASLVALAATISTTTQAAPVAKFDIGNFFGALSSHLHDAPHFPSIETMFITLGAGETAPTTAAPGAMDPENPAEYGSLNGDQGASGDSEASGVSAESDFAETGDQTMTPANSPSEPAPEASSSSSSGSGASEDWVTQMICRVNVVRAQNGAQPLGISSDLNKLAQGQSDYQNSINEMTHSNPAGGVGDRLAALGVSWASAAENVAAGMQTPEEAQDAWEKSPGHFANMVDPSMSYFGAASNNKYYTQEYYGPAGGARAEDIPQCN
ncbi:hypothetical protein IW140_000504 [Coemansia sp. RSA 1813]|nr:hypothetical protein EV178_004014 [Coemansia sp. RSA 1646]KAJ1773969.1 hypothetical protein LPJ74_000068 [Coemansia sp. RSA 1843]KAJ2213396.1 hypothetical protein EV179_003905 [Coemansia sp. RSA 487]KAJ2572741.1 hypothetical protein IW140_000504 [Coemansia sp. RSA 1813]